MDNKPQDSQAISKKEFREFVEEFQKTSKLELASSLLRTSYTKEIAKEDDERRTKQIEKTNEHLDKLNKSLENLSKAILNSNDKIASKLDKLGNQQSKEYKPLDQIKDKRPTTFREDLKSGVAGVKKFGSNIASGVTGFMDKIRNPTRTPTGDLKAAGGFLEKIGSQAKDILGTSKDYTVEGGRYAEAYSKTADGVKFQKGGKGSLDVGLENFNALKGKEEEIKKLEAKMKGQTDYGFEANKGDQEKLEKLKKQHSKLDLRNQSADIKPKKEEPKQETAPIERKQVDSPIVDQYGKSFKRDQTDDEMAAEKAGKSSLILDDSYRSKKQEPEVSQTANVEADNVESPQEIIAETAKDNLDLTKQLLETTKESLTQLKGIREALTATPVTDGKSTSGSPTAQSSSASASAAPAQQESSGGGLGDMVSDAIGDKIGDKIGSKVGSAAKGAKSIGGKILGGAKSIGGKVLSGAKGLASKIPGGALAGAGVGIAGMAGEYLGGKLEEAGHEKSGAAVSTLGTAAKYGGMGMAIGSIVPGVGTAIGGAVGGAVGLGMGLYENAGKMFGGGKKEEQGYSIPPGPDSQQKIFEKTVQERLDASPFDKNDVSVRKDIEDEVRMEMGGFIPNSKRVSAADTKQGSGLGSLGTIEAGQGAGDTVVYPNTNDEGQSKPAEQSFGDKLKSFFGFGETVQQRAAGGPVTKGKPYLVGEQGPEIVIPNESGKVKTDDQLNSAISSAASSALAEASDLKEAEDLAAGRIGIQDSKNVVRDRSKSADDEIDKILSKKGIKRKVNPDGSYELSGAWGTRKYDKNGQLLSEISPSVGGYQKETTTSGETVESYSAGPLQAKKTTSAYGDVSTTTSYDLGTAKVSAAQDTNRGMTKAAIDVKGGSEQNAAMRDEMSTSKTTQPVVSNNVQTSNNTNYVPIKADPRPLHRGSALDRYSDRVAAY